MGKNKVAAYPLRLDEEIMKKIKYLANKEDRPISKQIERLLRQSIKEYEAEHGEIMPPED